MSEIKKCAVSKKCGGCCYTGLPYGEQLKKKQQYIEGLLGRFGKVEPIIGMGRPEHYRNKVHHVFDRDRYGNIISGCYEAGSHKVVRVDGCLIEDEICQKIIFTIRELAKSFKIRTYEEDLRQGLLRHVLVRRGFATGEVMVVLVLARAELPGKVNFVKALLALHPEIKTIIINVNNKKTSMVLGENSRTIYGPGYIRDRLCGCTFRISPSSFYQVNPVQTEILYNTAIEFAGLSGGETVLDAYCGIGTIGLAIAKRYEKAGKDGGSQSAGIKVVGVELNGEAVRDAVTNSKDNGISNARFCKGDAGVFIDRMAREGEKIDVIMMDPPRSGSTKQFITSAVKINPKRIVYISCGPESLKRDLQIFKGLGYKAVKIQPVDMFPYTEHVETVVLLSKGVIDSQKVKVEFSLENMDTTSFRGKATYEQIKDYVLQQTGMKVSSLYISQVKRKCGLEVGDSYNKPKSEEAKRPQCPPEKEAAIMDALRHFGMIE